MDGVLKWTDENVFRRNPTKCKEMQIDFRMNRGASIPLESEGKQFEVVKSAKILGLTVRDDLKWNDHINNVTVKASQSVYLLKQLLKQTSFHSSLPAHLSDQLERIHYLRISVLEILI